MNAITQHIKETLERDYPNNIAEIREQFDSVGECKRFVKYVLERTGCFGNMVFFDSKIALRQLGDVDWHAIVDGDK